jgi:hypothetical protein
MTIPVADGPRGQPLDRPPQVREGHFVHASAMTTTLCGDGAPPGQGSSWSGVYLLSIWKRQAQSLAFARASHRIRFKLFVAASAASKNQNTAQAIPKNATTVRSSSARRGI